MKASHKFLGFIVGLVAVFAVTLGVGALVGPAGSAPTATQTHNVGSESGTAPQPMPAGHGH
ncbi:hypothetical protein [Rhodococcus sp. WAY2]|uniref:hypothetical protein n=1 Tax=Rhodococcus sp. WAY2 TaxID=2663121 RepID=UPI00131F5BEA|nr:hypothetical protein [Rhodococcus sp. WAY2]QHE74272.1 hypothetical protein GFS60_07968 [Rhodococcus sp. WAY2]